MKTKKLNKTPLQSSVKSFEKLIKHPEGYLSARKPMCESAKELVKTIYDHLKSQDEADNKSTALPELCVEGMDEEQIWQQLELQNSAQSGQSSIKAIAKQLAIDKNKFTLTFFGDDDESEDEEEEQLETEEEENDESALDDATENVQQEKKKKSGKEYRKTVVDDEFFKLNEMAAFLDAEDKKAMNGSKAKDAGSDEEDIDYFNEDSDDDEDSEDDAAQLKYKDYFVKKDVDLFGGKKVRKQKNFEGADESDDDDDQDENGLEDEEEEDEIKINENKNVEKEIDSASSSDDDNDDGKNKVKSSFENENDMLRERIDKMEKQAMEEKSWQLKGEIEAQTRPKNSLLEEYLDFDMTRRPAPIITEETTMSLEELIRNRIKNKIWDDVQRKVREDNNPSEFRKKLILDQEKSKESLAQIYEKEYLAKADTTKTGWQSAADDEPEEHKIIRREMDDLFDKLDALTNYHYTPRRVVPEAKIVTNIPTITMEEVAPTTFSNATHLAPEEVLNVKSTHLMGKSERTKTDKTRQRVQKKNKHKLFRALNEKAGIPEKTAAPIKPTKSGQQADKSLKSSTAFFNELQNTETLRKKDKASGKKKTPKDQLTFKQLKL